MLVENGKAISLELEQFNGIAPFADENIDVSIQDILFHVTGNDGREAVKTLSHIGWMTTKKIPGLLREVKHRLKDERFEILWIHFLEEADGSFGAQQNLTERN